MKRHANGPILTRLDIPSVSPTVADVSSVFNPGAIKLGQRYLLLLRVQTRGRETVFMIAEGRDGVQFAVRPKLVEIDGLDRCGLEAFHVYDARLTRIDESIYATFSVDTRDGCHPGVALFDGDRLELIGVARDLDSRNGVLFPERFGGRYLRLERPNRVKLASGVATGDQIVLSESDDLVDWRPVAPVLSGRPRYWDERIGSGPPPVKTREGWLHVYHGVATHFEGASIYQAGVCLLDPADPSKVIARGRNNILEPREPWEQVGQVPNVVFPTGIVVEELDEQGCALPHSPVRIYYGAADTVVGLAETTVEWLLERCRIE